MYDELVKKDNAIQTNEISNLVKKAMKLKWKKLKQQQPKQPNHDKFILLLMIFINFKV